MRGGGDSEPVIEQENLTQVQNDINLPLKRTYSPHKFFAFTLAEVLITLGVIGVVAALTIPSLIAKHQKKVYVTQLKKAYNTVTNAFKLMQAETGSDNLIDNDFITALTVGSSSNEAEVTRLAKKYFNIAQDVKYYSQSSTPVYRYLFYGNGTATVQPYGYLLKTADGADIYFNTVYPGPGQSVNLDIDVNGSNRAPNTVGRDYFTITFDQQQGKQGFMFGKSEIDPNIILLFCGGAQPHEGEPSACAERIMMEGWEMNY